jgi:hypothetical protein
MGTTLIVLGLVLLAAEKAGKRSRTLETLRWRDGILIGFAQAAALVPGVSPKSNIWLEKAIFPVYAWAGAEAKKKAPTAGRNTRYAIRGRVQELIL